MSEPTPRKFTMLDLMILIAGCAVGIAWTQTYHKSLLAQDAVVLLDWPFRLAMIVMYPAPILATISAALLVCRLLKPRPKLRRLFRQPGTVAMACVFLVLALGATMMLAGRGLTPIVKQIWPPPPGPGAILESSESLVLLYSVAEAGMVIAPCWLLLIVVGRWRPERSWIDRSGRCLGACLIAYFIATSLVNSLNF